jgi:hypothetical protein
LTSPDARVRLTVLWIWVLSVESVAGAIILASRPSQAFPNMSPFRVIVFLLSSCAIGAVGLAPHVARATCGDWTAQVAYPNVTPKAGGISRKALVPVSTMLAPSNHEPMRAPCRGPNCRSAPHEPAPVVPVTSTRIDSGLLAMDSEFDSLMPEVCSPVASDGARPTKGFPLGIEHPPRV